MPGLSIVTSAENLPDGWVIIQDIPIVGTGTYQLSTGETTFTAEDLADAIAAASEDPAVKDPRLKLGHTDEGWQAGEPSFGYYTNLHLNANGQEILADLYTLDWLAEVLPIAYPARSIEGAFGYESATGKFYRFVITAVSALGIELPGVSTLDDLREILENPEVEVVARASGKKPRVVVTAQVDAEDVRRQFFAEVAQGDRYWWWIRAVNLEPNEIIAEDEETGQLYRIPFTINERDVSFGEASEVYVEYKDEKVEETAKATIYSSSVAARSRTDNRTRGQQMNPEELRAQLGLPADATDEQVQARITELRAAAGDEQDPPDPDDTDGDDGDDEDDEQETNDDDDAEAGTGSTEQTPDPAVTAQDGTIVVDAEAFRQLQQQAGMGVAARQRQLKEDDDAVLDAAIKAGKFAPARRKHFAKLLAADRDGTKKLLKQLAPNVVPVEERGSARMDESEVAAGADVGGSAYDPAWLSPAERARVAAREAAAAGRS